ncbi:hypothetical protein BBJ28_00002378 [Nothophytophthora sp. Chile5]|nr:hypothetical protein BBJ28_00002378 [Nothophytophthora sp. Chile5]
MVEFARRRRAAASIELNLALPEPRLRAAQPRQQPRNARRPLEEQRARCPSPLEHGVDVTTLQQDLQGKEGMISVIQAKLDRWEATTLATLQEIRDLKDVFAQLNAS